ncbi:MAG: thiamine pyrophosphate-binding protein [Rhodospirillaceae bacterium]|jgi:acetolactate synthase I/II/III large subunit|nr:thiamine pyrophosphate-binding protein [Rhodospirillaceae bacterium]
MNNADLIVATLKAAGIDRGFGIPSGNVLPLVEAMRAGGIDFDLTAHEGSASFAADVTGRLTGAPGLCIATLGPGATNLATGVGSAYLDRSPMIAITCNLNTDQLGRRIQMMIDHHALFEPITKATLAMRTDNVAEVLEQAIRISMSEPQGPVHIDLPEDVMLAPATDQVPAVPAGDPVAARATDAMIAEAEKLMSGAKRPVAVIGSNTMRMADPSLLLAFIDHHGIPFTTTTMAKGMIDEDHPLSLGCIERARRQVQRSLIRSADLVIGLGYDTIEVEYEAWIANVPLLQVDIEPVDVDSSVTLAAEVTGDLDDSLTRLNALDATSNAWGSQEAAEHKKTFQGLLRPRTEGLVPHSVIDTVRATLPANGILAFDVGAHTHQIASQWATHEPKTFLITNGWSSMGFGLPAAIAAKAACPDRPVVCIIGDGCFQMTCGEVVTARRMGLTIPIVVLNDEWLSLIRVKQDRRQFKNYGSGLESGTATTPEHYFGVPAYGVTDGASLLNALGKAFAADGPTVIEAYVDPAHYQDTVFD